ncbi:ArsC family reductase [Dyadobacter sp. CY107]|uniref:ArsC family reductase n=1 Tax=Dyadobacter fanqingshengii TaxID=2906443 RepID=UPI001F23AF36|nr:ArsC family reductase [Dyadobacter fanqingshengii]MCF2502983.1 ArsC family reductase [Dyadobacter fanqingshengii]
MLTVYGIPNCDTVKKTRTWLEKNNIEYAFHNYKTEGISKDRIKVWFKSLPWDKVVNKGSTTWKGLSDEEKALITDEKSAAKLMIAHTSVIKRPLIEDESGKAVAIGFSEKEYAEKFL